MGAIKTCHACGAHCTTHYQWWHYNRHATDFPVDVWIHRLRMDYCAVCDDWSYVFPKLSALHDALWDALAENPGCTLVAQFRDGEAPWFVVAVVPGAL